MTTDAVGKRTEVLHGEQNVIKSELEFFSNSNTKIDTCMNYTRPALAITIEPIRGAFVNAKKRGIKLRYLTEITKDNISYCKELIPLVHEIRHLDGIKGNFMISESEYLAPIVLFENGKIASKIIYSNETELVVQHQYMFDTLWNKAISAQQKIKEIEEGIVEYYQTRFLESPEEVSEELEKVINTSEDDSWSICSTFDGLLMLTCNKGFEKMQGRLVDSTRRGNNTRWVGTINKDNVWIIKTYLDLGMKIKHIKNMPPMNFATSSKELYATIDEMKEGQIAKNLLISNEPHYIRHYISIFEDLWKNGVKAEDRIKEIETGLDLADIEVIPGSARAQDLYLDIVKTASKEVLWIFPTTNAFLRQDKMGAIPLAVQAARERNVKVRILMPTNNLLEQKVQQIKEYCPSCQIHTRYIEQMSETRATILVVDRRHTLVMELKDDSKSTFYEAIGLSTYSNSKAGVLSYVAIFENLWKQSELYEQLKVHDKMQREFIDIAAHELRTPIQPILGLSEVVLQSTKDVQQAKFLEIINRNAKRLLRLTEDVLDVTKIESHSLNLKKEQFNLKDVITNAIDDIMANKVSYKAKNANNYNTIKFLYKPQDVLVYADKARIGQVIHNLLDNAVKFINYKEESYITVQADKKERYQQQQLKNNDQQQIIIRIMDTGEGVDPQIFPRLFTKFATKSETGTGLGLFICKGIVEAHGGRIWAENNADGKGATFSFSLPIDN